MNEKMKLSGQKRAGGIGESRRQGLIPAVIYGQGLKENISLLVKKQEFDKLFQASGENHLIDLDLSGQIHSVLVKDVQMNAKNGQAMHVDFYQVDMSKELEVELPLRFVGESKAVKELGGTFIRGLDMLHAKCLPGSLVDSIEVDLSSLEEPGQHILVADLKIPSGIKIENHSDEVVASVLEGQAEVVEPVAAPSKDAKDTKEVKK